LNGNPEQAAWRFVWHRRTAEERKTANMMEYADTNGNKEGMERA
jgi:hypothetical protein